MTSLVVHCIQIGRETEPDMATILVPVKSSSIQLHGADLYNFDSSLYTGDITLFMIGCLQSSIELSVKHNNENGRHTLPLLSEDSYRK